MSEQTPARHMDNLPEDRKKHWTGTAPTACDIDGTVIKDNFVDGRTRRGPWANMCLSCHRTQGVGLGTGKGQHYKKQGDGRWLKVEG